jgi:hypothetical protein
MAGSSSERKRIGVAYLHFGTEEKAEIVALGGVRAPGGGLLALPFRTQRAGEGIRHAGDTGYRGPCRLLRGDRRERSRQCSPSSSVNWTGGALCPCILGAVAGSDAFPRWTEWDEDTLVVKGACSMARHGQHFDQFRDILIEWNMPEKRGTRWENFVVLQDGRVLTLAEALDQLPEAELSSPGGFNTDQSYQPVFLDIYREPSGRYSRHSIKARWYLELEQKESQEEERRRRWVKERFPDARYYLCEFAQDLWGRMYVRNVLSLEGESMQSRRSASCSRRASST